jgi:hypothetical protein
MRRLTGYDWTNAFILTSDCEVVEETDGALTFTDTPIPIPEGYVNIESVFITSNGKRYRLVPEAAEPVDVPPIKPELNTFQDCWEAVQPEVTLDPKGIKHMNLPSVKAARQIQAAIKLFVIQHALNKGPVDMHAGYTVYYDGALMRVNNSNVLNSDTISPFVFKTYELALKSIEIGEDIWLQYFGIFN